MVAGEGDTAFAGVVLGEEGDEGVAVVSAEAVEGAEPEEAFRVLEDVAYGVVGQAVGGGHVGGTYLDARRRLHEGEEEGQK